MHERSNIEVPKALEVLKLMQVLEGYYKYQRSNRGTRGTSRHTNTHSDHSVRLPAPFAAAAAVEESGKICAEFLGLSSSELSSESSFCPTRSSIWEPNMCVQLFVCMCMCVSVSLIPSADSSMRITAFYFARLCNFHTGILQDPILF